MVRGQAMAEYSAITFMIGCGLLGLSAVPVGTNGPLLALFWTAINQFYDSVYFVLECSIP
jgi:hypothetical protein